MWMVQLSAKTKSMHLQAPAILLRYMTPMTISRMESLSTTTSALKPGIKILPISSILLRKINSSYIKEPIYCLIFNNYDINNDDNDIITIGKSMTYVKIIMIYPNYIKIDNNIIERNNIQSFNTYFKRGDFNGSTLIYKINSKYKIFNHLLQ